MAHGGRRAKRWKWRLGIALVVLIAGLTAAVTLARSYWRRPSPRDPSRLALLYAAASAFNAQRYEQARDLLDRRAGEVEPTPLDWMLRARIAEAQGDLPGALSYLEKIPDDAPIAAQASLKRGQIERARNRARRAEAALRQALRRDPDLIQAYRELAYLCALQRRKAECDEQFQALAARMPLDPVLAFAWCQNYCDIWDPYASGEVLEKFVEADPADRASRLALAVSYQLSNRPGDAEAVLRALPSTDADALAIRAQVAIDNGAIERARSLVRQGPADHPRLNVLRGQLALFAGDATQAAAHYREALAGDPEDRDALQGLGLALRRLGDPEAERFLRAASRHDQLKRAIQDSVSTLRTDPKLFSKLGRLCAELNRTAEARAWFQLAVGRDPLDAEAQQALARLEERDRGGTTAVDRRGAKH
jgi:tetratricopeptide (TPR) repeat protein